MSRSQESRQQASPAPSAQTPAPASRLFAPLVQCKATAPSPETNHVDPANPDLASGSASFADRLLSVDPGSQQSTPLHHKLSLGSSASANQPTLAHPSQPMGQRLFAPPITQSLQVQRQAIAFSKPQQHNTVDATRSVPAPSFHTPLAEHSLHIQPKLTIGAPNDKYEQEADRVAEEVVRRLSFAGEGRSQPNQGLQRKTSPGSEALTLKPLAPHIQRIELSENSGLQQKSVIQREGGDDDKPSVNQSPTTPSMTSLPNSSSSDKALGFPNSTQLSKYWQSVKQQITDPETGKLYNPRERLMERINPMQEEFSKQYPELSKQLSSGYESVSNLASQGRDLAFGKVDQGMQYLGNKALNVSRENFKLAHYPDDSYKTMFQKYAFNGGVDVLATLSSPIIRGATGFLSGVGDKLGSSTLDRIHPKHLETLMAHPEFVRHYLSQRKQQLMQPLDLYNDPKGFSQKKFGDLRKGLENYREHYSGLDSGAMNTITHGGRTLVDMVQEGLAPALGVALATFMMYNMPKKKANTNAAMDKMFPKETFYGKTARFLPNRIMFTKPISKIRGNPAFSLMLLSYLMATNLGKKYEDNQKLHTTNPAMYKRLKETNSESYASGFHLGIQESMKRTSKPQKGGSWFSSMWGGNKDE